MEKCIWYYSFPIGTLGIAEDGEGITDVIFGDGMLENARKEETALLKQTARELNEYFAGKRQGFQVKLHMQGTDFQKKVWNALLKIPYGETRSYKQIAENIGNSKACRAVGMANNKNPLPILVPCHRVVGADNSLVGYALGLEVKQYLLNMESGNPGQAERIKKELWELRDLKFREFASALIPNVPKERILGVRLPLLRKLARQIARGDWEEYLKTAKGESYEEIMLKGMVIGYIKADLFTVLSLVDQFLPSIDNWSVCDSFCAGLKITKEYKEEVWDYLMPCLFGKEEYSIRFGIVMLIFYFVDEEHIKPALKCLDKINHESYYVKMAVAWAVSMYYLYNPVCTENYLKECHLDDFTYNKAIQKVCESNRADGEMKARVRAMKRKV